MEDPLGRGTVRFLINQPKNLRWNLADIQGDVGAWRSLGTGLWEGFAALFFIIQHPEWRGREEEKKKGILKKHICWEAQSAGLVGSALLLAAVFREEHK